MTDPDKNIYEVEVAGLPLKLRSSHEEATVKELIGLVDEKVKEAMSGSPNVSFQKALLLTCLHIAEDLVFLRRAALSELESLEAKANEVLSDLESSPVSRIRLDN